MKTVALVVLGLLLSASQSVYAEGVENFSLEAIGYDATAQVEPDFHLKDHEGKTVVLHFLLKTECPLCLKYTNEYAKLAAKTPDVIHVFIKPDSESEIRAWASKLVKVEGVEQPTIYRDAGAKLAKRFGIPDGYAFHGQIVHYPALIVLDGEGREMFRHVGKSNTDRLPKDEFVKKLQAMTAK